MPFLATGFGIFLLRQAFLQIPRDLQEAAPSTATGTALHDPGGRAAGPPVDGRPRRLLLPRRLEPVPVAPGRPPAATTPLRTVQIGLKQLLGSQVTQIRVALAGAVIAFVPLVILLVIFQKQLVRSLTAGAVK